MKRLLAGLFAACFPLGAWSPHMHEVQTAKALRLIPWRMAAFLRAHPAALMEGARGVANDEPPTPDQVEAEYRTVLRMSGERARPEEIARELGVLAHQVQLLLDPSAVQGLSPLREDFEAYADQWIPHLVVTQEPFWAAEGRPDLDLALRRFQAVKLARHQGLLEHFDQATGRRLGSWDDRSVPFAQLQLSFSNAIYATANVWILAWRQAGNQWELPQAP